MKTFFASLINLWVKWIQTVEEEQKLRKQKARTLCGMHETTRWLVIMITGRHHHTVLIVQIWNYCSVMLVVIVEGRLTTMCTGNQAWWCVYNQLSQHLTVSSMAVAAFIMWTISLLPKCGQVITLMYGRTLTIFTITLGNVNTAILTVDERRRVCFGREK